MSLLDKHIVYFIGIGGIGMSALARWFKATGHEVYGYDRTETNLTIALVSEGISVHYEDNIDEIPPNSTKENTLVVYTPAVSSKHSEFNYFINKNHEVVKRSFVLGLISKQYFTVAVAGTHGKTTTSSMIAHLLHNAGVDTTAFLGGIATNFDTNMLIGKTPEAIAVVEADEFDRSFLQLSPDLEIITSVDPDHLDIYGDSATLINSFHDFIGRLKPNGNVYLSEKAGKQLGGDVGEIYGINTGSSRAENIRVSGNSFCFDYVNGQSVIKNLKLSVPGYHNTENAIVAIKVALKLGLSPEMVKEGIASYLGVKRRFEYIIKTKEVIFVDDYAHHPEELSAFIKSMKALYPDEELSVVFQPHLFSRTADFADGFAESLDMADNIYLLDIYPAREEPIPGVTSEIILERMKSPNKQLITEESMIAILRKKKPRVFATIGAGDIDKMVDGFKQKLSEVHGIVE